VRERRALLHDASSKQTDEDLAWHHDDLHSLIIGSLGQLEDQRRVLERRMAAQERILLLHHRSTNRLPSPWTSLDPSDSGGGWGGGEKKKETEKEAVIAMSLTIAERAEKEKENHGQRHALAKLYCDWDALTAEIQKLKLYHIEVHTASPLLALNKNSRRLATAAHTHTIHPHTRTLT